MQSVENLPALPGQGHSSLSHPGFEPSGHSGPVSHEEGPTQSAENLPALPGQGHSRLSIPASCRGATQDPGLVIWPG
jgi:hypothetical protein